MINVDAITICGLRLIFSHPFIFGYIIIFISSAKLMKKYIGIDKELIIYLIFFSSIILFISINILEIFILINGFINWVIGCFLVMILVTTTSNVIYLMLMFLKNKKRKSSKR